MLELPEKELRAPRSFTLLPTTVQRIEALADAYGTNSSRIIEAMVIQFGPKLLAQAPQKEES